MQKEFKIETEMQSQRDKHSDSLPIYLTTIGYGSNQQEEILRLKIKSWCEDQSSTWGIQYLCPKRCGR